ncbi:hypothetical protein P3S68_009479 [Capsicum galapagoense]
MSSYTVKVEESRSAADGKPSARLVYRSIYAKHGLMEVPTHFELPWDLFRTQGRMSNYTVKAEESRPAAVDKKEIRPS